MQFCRNTFFLVIVCCTCYLPLFAQEQDIYIKGNQPFWIPLIPSHATLQYAGGAGIVSAGFGWEYGKSGQWETDILLGLVPAYSTSHVKTSFTLKQRFLPWNKRRVNHLFTIDPIAFGLSANVISGNDFWTKEPDQYPGRYYGFSTRWRFWIYVGQRFTFIFPADRKYPFRSVTAFYEASSCDLYLFSVFSDNYLKPKNVLTLALGLKLAF